MREWKPTPMLGRQFLRSQNTELWGGPLLRIRQSSCRQSPGQHSTRA